MKIQENTLYKFVDKALILAMTCLSLLVISCNTLEGHRGVSKNIEESKRRKVFIANYSSSENPYKVNDSLIIYIKSAWLERKWHYTSKMGESKFNNGYRLIIETDSKSLKDYSESWIIGVDYNRYFEINPKYNLLHIEFESIPQNKEVFKVQKGNTLKAEISKDIVGEFVIEKD